MSLNFPSSPDVNDTYTFAGTTWRYDGVAWNVLSPQDSYLSAEGAQTVRNKSISGGDNTLASIPQSSVTGLSTDLSGKASATELSGHTSSSTSVHGITNTADLVVTTDARLADTRTPTDGSVTDAKIVAGGLSTTAITGTAVVTGDSRLSDQRTPLDNSVTSAKIVDGTIVNADIATAAAIAQSKVSGLTTDLAAKAPLSSPTFTGTPAGPTAAAGTNTTQLATTAFVAAGDALQSSNPKPVDTKTAAYTLVLSDRDKIIQMNSTSALTITVPTNASVAFGNGAIIHIANINTGTLTIAGASGVTVNQASGLTLSRWESGTLYRRATDSWVFLKGGGLGAANFSNTATGTYTDGGGQSWKYLTYTSSGTLTVTQAGFADVLLVAGGGGGKGAQWNGFGCWNDGYILLDVGNLTVTVGAGGAGNTASVGQNAGGASSLGNFYAQSGSASGIGTGQASSITGSAFTYSLNAQVTRPANSGYGGNQSGSLPGASGVVIVRVRI